MKKKYHLYLTADEWRIMLDRLIEMKNELIRTGRYSDAIDEIIINVIKAKVNRVRVKEVQP